MFGIAVPSGRYWLQCHSPGQRGSNESINRGAREFWDKGTALPTDQAEVDRVATMINNIPRGVLGSYTPYEKFIWNCWQLTLVSRRLDRSEHLRGIALGFRNLSHYILRSLIFPGRGRVTVDRWQT